MSTRAQIASLVFMMVQPVLFGIGIVLILTTPLVNAGFVSIPVMIALTMLLSIPASWAIAPRLRLRQAGVRSPRRD